MESGKTKKKILILVNHDVVIYNFRLELVERFLEEGYEVYLSSPIGSHTQTLIDLGIRFNEIEINRHGLNPFEEIDVLKKYVELIKETNPNVILSFTLKPNIYGAVLGRKYGIPVIANITGIGLALGTGALKRKTVSSVYRKAFKNIQCVFMQNKRDLNLFKRERIAIDKLKLLPGSGVNLERFNYLEYPPENKPMEFVMIGRIMKIKGVEEFFEAAGRIKKEYPDVRFRMVGFFDGHYESKVTKLKREGIIEYTEQQEDILPILKEANAVVHASHLEGMSNVLLEAAAAGRPVIASNIPGCRETFDEGKSGFGFEAGDVEGLERAILRFIRLPYGEKKKMGENGRKKMIAEFDRKNVTEAYMNELRKIL